jgi:hypothetical protein
MQRSSVLWAVSLVFVIGALLSAPPAAAKGSKKRRSSVTFVNSSSWDIYALFLSASDEEYWGPDQLGDHILYSGEKFTLTSIRCGIYDLMLVDEDEDQCVLVEVDICGSERLVITDQDLLACQGYDASSTITFYNQSSWEIHYLFLSPSDNPRWGPDQLGYETLEPGDYLELSGIECDTFDIRLIDEDGDECIIKQVDICADDTGWRITNKVLLACEGY